MDPHSFFQRCEQHDWTYEYSEDNSVPRRGEQAQRELEALAASDPTLQRIFAAWHEYIEASALRTDPEARRPQLQELLHRGAG